MHESGARIQTVPLAPLKRIFIHSDVMLDSGLLGVLGERGIGMVVMSGSADVPRILFLLKEGRSVFFPAWEARMGQVREQMRELGRWLQGEPFDFSSVTLSDLADEVEDNA